MKFCYALLLATAIGLPVSAQQRYPVQFNFSTEFFPENYPDARQSFTLAAGEVVNGYVVRYLQCYQIPSSENRNRLEQEGLHFLSYVSFGTYLVAIPENFDIENLAILNPRSIVEVEPAWKLANSLRQQPPGEWAVHGDLIDVNIQVYSHVTISQGAEWCRQNGLTVLTEGNQNGFLQLRLPKENLDALAAFGASQDT